jgi:hypothetical protein
VNGQGGSDTVLGGSGLGGDPSDQIGDLVIGLDSEINEDSALVTGANIGWTALVD